jgi:oxygen-independent coproporphyrinogen-3 oxidase
MAGLYLHIPFCKQACHYCDFHFSTSLGLKSQFVDALLKEMALRRHYLPDPTAPLETIYFGGGTPSLLTGEEMSRIFAAIQENFVVSPQAEITLEANPDDLTAEKLAVLAASPVNRLSIGLQSFHEPHLRLMNRAHSAQESGEAVRRAQAAGFENISVDLIYGVPAANHTIWENDLARLFELGVPHVSAYALTIEPDTAFGRRLQKGTFVAPPDEFVARQFEILLAQLRQHGYEQYEISNFCQPGRESRHNGNYWRGVPYLGLGPSAHSFDGRSRQYAVANNPRVARHRGAPFPPRPGQRIPTHDPAHQPRLRPRPPARRAGARPAHRPRRLPAQPHRARYGYAGKQRIAPHRRR